MRILIAVLLVLVLGVLITRPRLSPLAALAAIAAFTTISLTLFRAYMSVTETLITTAILILLLVFARLESR